MSDLDRRVVLAAAAMAGVAGVTGLTRRASGGGLSPPGGAVTPTGRSLEEIYNKIGGPSGIAEPRTPLSAATTPGNAQAYFRITQPGSYYLTQNHAAIADRSAISIESDGVTLDLNGFAIIGLPGGSNPGVVAITTGTSRGFVLRNGTIRAWGGYVTLGQLPQAVFEDLVIKGAFAGNLEASARNSIFRRISIESTGEVGIQGLYDCLIEDCVVGRDSDAPNGLSEGISAGPGSIVRNCTVFDCGNGIKALGATVSDCVVSGCTSVSSWDDAGILGSNGSTIERCRVTGCLSAGVRVTGTSTARFNQVFGCKIGIADGGFAGNRNRVEDNSVTFSADEGVRFDKPRNVIARNTVSNSGTSDFSIVAGNALGEVLDLTAGGTLSATQSAWANIRF